MTEQAKPPAKLNAAGRRAWDRATAALTEPERESFADIVEAFAWEVDMADRLRRSWRDAGAAMSSDAVASIRACDRTIASLARELRLTPASAHREARRGMVGRPKGAVSAPDRKAQADATPVEAPAPTTAEPPRITLVRDVAS